jgi:hypothetical protein
MAHRKDDGYIKVCLLGGKFCENNNISQSTRDLTVSSMKEFLGVNSH